MFLLRSLLLFFLTAKCEEEKIHKEKTGSACVYNFSFQVYSFINSYTLSYVFFFFFSLKKSTYTLELARLREQNELTLCSLINKYVKLLFSFILLQFFFVLYFQFAKKTSFCVFNCCSNTFSILICTFLIALS